MLKTHALLTPIETLTYAWDFNYKAYCGLYIDFERMVSLDKITCEICARKIDKIRTELRANKVENINELDESEWYVDITFPKRVAQ